MPSSQEEAVLYLQPSEVRFEVHVVLATFLLPSAPTLKAVLLAYSTSRGFKLVCVSLPLLCIHYLATSSCLCT